MPDEPLKPRVEKLETEVRSLGEQIDAVDKKVDIVQTTITEHGFQIGRLVSHIESEVGLARKDLGRIETRLFGADQDVNGGRIGFINKRIYRIEIWGLALIAAAAILVFLFGTFQFLRTTAPVAPAVEQGVPKK